VVRAGRRSASRRQALAQTRTTPPRLKGDEYGADVRLHDARGIVRFAFIVRRAQTGPSDEHRRLSTTLAWMVSVGILYHLPRADGTARRGLKASASDLGTLLVFYPVTGSIKPEQCQGVCDKVTAEHGATQGAFFRFTVLILYRSSLQPLTDQKGNGSTPLNPGWRRHNPAQARRHFTRARKATLTLLRARMAILSKSHRCFKCPGKNRQGAKGET
jgi:hypothetical protein